MFDSHHSLAWGNGVFLPRLPGQIGSHMNASRCVFDPNPRTFPLNWGFKISGGSKPLLTPLFWNLLLKGKLYICVCVFMYIDLPFQPLAPSCRRHHALGDPSIWGSGGILRWLTFRDHKRRPTRPHPGRCFGMTLGKLVCQPWPKISHGFLSRSTGEWFGNVDLWTIDGMVLSSTFWGYQPIHVGNDRKPPPSMNWDVLSPFDDWGNSTSVHHAVLRWNLVNVVDGMEPGLKVSGWIW